MTNVHYYTEEELRADVSEALEALGLTSEELIAKVRAGSRDNNIRDVWAYAKLLPEFHLS